MTHHAEGLRKLTHNEELIKDLSNDFRLADLNASDRTMLEYAARLTSQPWSMTEDHINMLRETGFTDAAILDIIQVTGYFAFVNRLADGLGVELEDYWDDKD